MYKLLITLLFVTVIYATPSINSTNPSINCTKITNLKSCLNNSNSNSTSDNVCMWCNGNNQCMKYNLCSKNCNSSMTVYDDGMLTIVNQRPPDCGEKIWKYLMINFIVVLGVVNGIYVGAIILKCVNNKIKDRKSNIEYRARYRQSCK